MGRLMTPEDRAKAVLDRVYQQGMRSGKEFGFRITRDDWVREIAYEIRKAETEALLRAARDATEAFKEGFSR